MVGYVQVTQAQTVQFRRLLAAGYDPSTARIMIERGAWIGTAEMLPETVADIEEFRWERDAKREPQPKAR
jgi:hypothetical protein